MKALLLKPVVQDSENVLEVNKIYDIEVGDAQIYFTDEKIDHNIWVYGEELLEHFFIFQELPEPIKEQLVEAAHEAAMTKTYRGRDFFIEQADTIDRALYAIVGVLQGEE